MDSDELAREVTSASGRELAAALQRIEHCLNQLTDEQLWHRPSPTAADLVRVRRIQGWDVSGLAAIFDAVPHFRGHTQEIIFRTRLLLGDRYQFAWQPATMEQGA